LDHEATLVAVLGQVAEFKDGDIGVLRVGTPRSEKLIENSKTTSSWQRKALKLEGSGTHRVRVEYPWYKELSHKMAVMLWLRKGQS
jgi:Asp-tRNA(Asn)/Glu-tRNA(Gln) amidotransferase A subunit family amidase